MGPGLRCCALTTPPYTLQVFREDGLISGSPNFGLDWFEGAIAKPDAVLADFYSAFHPTTSVSGMHALLTQRLSQLPTFR